MHTFRQVTDEEGKAVYQVGFAASGADVLDPRQFRVMASYAEAMDAAALVAWLNGGSNPAELPAVPQVQSAAAGEHADEPDEPEHHARRGGRRA